MEDRSIENTDGTIRSLSNRHVQMIAIVGTIGTSLFLGGREHDFRHWSLSYFYLPHHGPLFLLPLAGLRRNVLF